APACIKTCKTSKITRSTYIDESSTTSALRVCLIWTTKRARGATWLTLATSPSSSLNVIYRIGSPALPVSPRMNTTMLAPVSTLVISSSQSSRV
ncbi:hypothetical protein D6D22_09532, partial [Aureobasidium pullulans]